MLRPGITRTYAWTYGHLFLYAAVAVLGVGIHHATDAAAGRALGSYARLAVAGSLAAFRAGLAVVEWQLRPRAAGWGR